MVCTSVMFNGTVRHYEEFIGILRSIVVVIQHQLSNTSKLSSMPAAP